MRNILIYSRDKKKNETNIYKYYRCLIYIYYRYFNCVTKERKNHSVPSMLHNLNFFKNNV